MAINYQEAKVCPDIHQQAKFYCQLSTQKINQPSISYKCFQYHCLFILCDVFLDRLTNIYAVDIKQSRIWTKTFTNLEKLWTNGQVWTRSWGIFTSHLKCKTYKCPRCQCYVFMCLLYFVLPRLISSNILWLYLVSSCFILSCHVQICPSFFRSKTWGTSNQLAGDESPASYCELYGGHRAGPEKRKTSRNEKTRHAMTTNDMQDISSKMLKDEGVRRLVWSLWSKAMPSAISSAQGNQPTLKEFLAKRPVLKSFLRLRQLPWCQTLKISGYRKGIAVTCLWHKWCTHVLALVSIHITERGQISLLMVFSSMEIIRAHVKRTRREGWVWCHVWCRDSMIGNFWPLWYRYQAVVKDIDAWEPKARASWVKHHSWHFMTSCLWLQGLIISECSWLLTFQFVQICVVHSLVGSIWGEWQSWQSILPEINARWSRVAF